MKSKAQLSFTLILFFVLIGIPLLTHADTICLYYEGHIQGGWTGTLYLNYDLLDFDIISVNGAIKIPVGYTSFEVIPIVGTAAITGQTEVTASLLLMGKSDYSYVDRAEAWEIVFDLNNGIGTGNYYQLWKDIGGKLGNLVNVLCEPIYIPPPQLPLLP